MTKAEIRLKYPEWVVSEDEKYLIYKDTYYRSEEPKSFSCTNCDIYKLNGKTNKHCPTFVFCVAHRIDKKNSIWIKTDTIPVLRPIIPDKRSEFDKMVCEALLK